MTDRTPLQNEQTTPGWYIKLQTDVLNQLPRPPEMDKVTAQRWTNKNGAGLNKFLSGLITPPKIELSDKRFHIISTFDLYFDKKSLECELMGVVDAVQSQNFKHGQKFKVDVINAHAVGSVNDCINFLEQEQALFLGGLGTALVYQEQKRRNKKNECPTLWPFWIASFASFREEYPFKIPSGNFFTIPGIIGLDYVNYEFKDKTPEELVNGPVLFFCFRDAS